MFMSRSPASIAVPISRGLRLAASQACIFARTTFRSANLRCFLGIPSIYSSDNGHTGSVAGIIPATKFSNSPVDKLSGISQIPTRGLPLVSIMVPVRAGRGGEVNPAAWSRSATACHLPSKESFASTTMPTAALPSAIISPRIPRRSSSQPPLAVI